jgi:hypothetical protein
MAIPPSFLPNFLFGFRSYNLEDIRFLESLAASSRLSDPKLIIDYFGMRIDPDYEPAQEARRGEVIGKAPFPTDTFLAEGIEYAALAQSLMHAGGRFSLIEVGAGWGPWITLAAICGRRLGKSRIEITAIEADHERFSALRRHLALNQLVPVTALDDGADGDLVWRLHEAVAWFDDAGARWPEGELADAGRQALEAGNISLQDYRGRLAVFSKRPSIPLSRIVQMHERVDLLHIDLQGVETVLISRALTDLNDKVRRLFVGTHSRLIEGELLALMFREGWLLEREEPCLFRTAAGNASIEGLTIRDGGQLWVNPRLNG